MAKDNDRRLIEGFLPIQAISAEASREKSVRKGHISTLHLWEQFAASSADIERHFRQLVILPLGGTQEEPDGDDAPEEDANAD